MHKKRNEIEEKPKMVPSRRRALTSLPVPKLSEECASIAMQIEQDNLESYSSFLHESEHGFETPRSDLFHKNKTVTTKIFSDRCSQPEKVKISIRLKEQGQNRLYFNSTYAKIKNDIAVDLISKHESTEKFRAKMLDWMIEVLKFYGQTEQTVFRAWWFLDFYLLRTNVSVKPLDLHLLGSTCIFLASKQEEIRPIKLSVLISEICKNKVTSDDIMNKEFEIMNTINFMSQTPNFYCLTKCCLPLFEIEDLVLLKFIDNITLLIIKMAIFFRNLMSQFTCCEMTGAAIIMSLKLAENLQENFNAEAYVS